MKNPIKDIKITKIFWGIVFVLVGMGLTLDIFEILPFMQYFGMWWPVLLIIFGLIELVADPRRYLSALIMIGVGAMFQLDKLYDFQISVWSLLLPFVLIVVGIRIIFGSQKKVETDAKPADYTNTTAIFGASEVSSSSKQYKGGIMTALFGGAKIDLTKAKIEDTAVIDVNVAFGGGDIIIPENWIVNVDVLPIFGGVGNHSKVPDDGKVLIVRGIVAFGGVEIKNVDED